MKRPILTWIAAAVLVACLAGGCQVSREIVDLKPPADLPALQELDQHLDYVDPDAGRPDYRRDL